MNIECLAKIIANKAAAAFAAPKILAAVRISNTITAFGYKWISRLDYQNLPALQPRVADLCSQTKWIITDQLTQIPSVLTPHPARRLQPETCLSYALGALEFQGIPPPGESRLAKKSNAALS
jgi:hypothetical protein